MTDMANIAYCRANARPHPFYWLGSAFGAFDGSGDTTLRLCGKPESTARAPRVQPWRDTAWG